MILTDQDVIKLYKSPSKIDALKQEHKKLLAHFHGIDISSYITQLEGLENDSKIKLRKRLTRSNMDMWEDVLRPTDKIFTANGGSVEYQIDDKKKKEEFQEYLSKVYNGISLNKWMRSYFLDKFVCDPNGIFLIEHKDNKPYPTYKSILTIKHYKQSGQSVDYIMFEDEKVEIENQITVTYVRVYDDEGDKTYRVVGESLVFDEEKSYPNPWGKVPAVIISDIINTITEYKQTPVFKQMELADEYFREGSVKTLFKYHHAFPLYWQYLQACQTCKGTGYIEASPCKVCNGTGYALKKDVSDITYLRPPENKDDPTIAPDIAGYVVPPIESWTKMSEELKLLRDMIYFSHWGTVINREDTDKTAFEVAVNTQPMQDRLKDYTSSLETCETEIVNLLGKYFLNDAYKGCSINRGRDYIIKSTNQIITQYLDAKVKNASVTILNDLLLQYYNTLYANDPTNLLIHKKLINVEPLVHYTIEEVKSLGMTEDDYLKKLYYSEWLSTLTNDDLIRKTEINLRESLNKYIQTKKEKDETEEVSGVQGDQGSQDEPDGEDSDEGGINT